MPRTSLGVLPAPFGFVPQVSLTLIGQGTSSTTFVDFGINTGMGYVKRFGAAKSNLLVRMGWSSYVATGSVITQDTGVRVNGQDISMLTFLFSLTNSRMFQSAETLITGLPAQSYIVQPRWRVGSPATLSTDSTSYLNLYVCEVWTGS